MPIEEVEQNFKVKIASLAKSHPFMKVLFFEEVTLVDSLLPSDTFNVVCGGDFSKPHTCELARFIVEYFSQQNFPFAWWIPDQQTHAEKLLSSLGMTLDEKATGMLAETDKTNPIFSVSNQLSIQAVETPQQLNDFGHILASIFSPFDHNVHQFYKFVSPFLKQSDSQAFIGYLDQIPVAVGSLIFDKDCAGIYDIATLFEHRKKGYGTHMTSYLIQEAKKRRFKKLALLASPEGEPIYAKLGFQPVGTFHVYGNHERLKEVPSVSQD